MRVQLKTLGCRVNEAELETWARAFQKAGHQISADHEEADLLVLNSCAVTQDAVRKSRALIRKLGKEHPAAKIILSGCYATLHPEEAATLGVDLVIENQDKHRLVEIAIDRLPVEIMPEQATDPEGTALFRLGRHRAFIKVQDGCRYRCSYCIVTLARGEERSRSVEEILAEIHEFEDQGIGEVVLTGIHLGGYGSDSGSDLASLLEIILAKTQIPRIRLGSLEPWDIPDQFIALFKNPRLMPHLHLPLQSGSDTVLKRMARRTRRDDFVTLVERLRKGIPDINLTSDIIVGFPGETPAEWAETVELTQSVEFGGLHIFSYSPRPGTAASAMPHRIPGDIQVQRSRELHEIARTQKNRAMSRLVGQSRAVLWEGLQETVSGPVVSGYTPEYHRVMVSVNEAQAVNLPHTISAVDLVGLDPSTGCLLGHILAPSGPC
jgi:threonylcarbamoyladenosine tRNA methylthiotransferase MtaB